MITTENLEALSRSLHAAPRDDAAISLLCYRPAFGQRVFPEMLDLCPTRGVLGDRWAEHAWLRTPDGAPDPRIQVALINQRVLDAVWQDRENAPYPGDTLVANMALSEEHLPAGTRLQAGTAMLEVSDVYNDGCVKWKARYGRAAYDWARAELPERRRGLFCRIISGGTITLGDRLRRI